MKRKRIIVAYIIAAIVIAGVMVFALRPSEPEYQGRRLSEWLEDLSRTPYPEKGSDQAAKAIREMGTNAIPFLVGTLKAKDSTLKIRFVELVRKQKLFPIPLRLAGERRNTSCDAFLILGSRAKAAIPEITTLLDDSALFGDASMSLFAIGNDSVPALRQSCNHTNPDVRTEAAWVLSKFVPKHRGGFTTSYYPSGSTNRVFAFSLTLGDDDIVALAENLNDPDPKVRRASAEALEWLSGLAKPAVPALIKALDDSDRFVRESAAKALQRIDPQAATKAGLK
jgi:hypothetical protein